MPQNIYNLIRSYHSERKAGIATNYERIFKSVSKGCPQGSVLGLQLWNLILDEVLKEISETGSEPIAYTDDLAIVVTGNARMEMERKANTIVNILVKWCNK